MISGVTNPMLDELGRVGWIVHPPYTLVCYTNARNSLTLDSRPTDLVQPLVQNGYLPILLDASQGVWTSVNGDVLFSSKIRWNATGPWNAPVTGVAMVYQNIIALFYDIYIAGTPTDFVPINGSFLEVDLHTVV